MILKLIFTIWKIGFKSTDFTD